MVCAHLAAAGRVRLLVAALAVAGCTADGPAAADRELTVFAAASLRDAAGEAAEAWTAGGGAPVRFNFAGSNVLAQQLLAAPAAGDVFLSADQRWMDELEAAGRLVPGSRRTLLTNRLVVVAQRDSGWSLGEPAELAALPFRHLSLADPEAVPAGVYARDWLRSVPASDDPAGGDAAGGDAAGGTLWDRVADRVAPAPDVRGALALVEADPEILGVVYRTDAASSARVRVLYAVPPETGPEICYAAAAIASGRDPATTLAFLDFLDGAAARALFARHGFVPVAAVEGGDG